MRESVAERRQGGLVQVRGYGQGHDVQAGRALRQAGGEQGRALRAPRWEGLMGFDQEPEAHCRCCHEWGQRQAEHDALVLRATEMGEELGRKKALEAAARLAEGFWVNMPGSSRGAALAARIRAIGCKGCSGSGEISTPGCGGIEFPGDCCDKTVLCPSCATSQSHEEV